MEKLGEPFIQAVVVAFGTMFAGGLVFIIKLLMKVSHDMKSIGPSVKTLYRIQPYLTNAIRHQNSAFRELGANGSTVKSNECLDEVDKLLNQKLASNAIGQTSAYNE